MAPVFSPPAIPNVHFPPELTGMPPETPILVAYSGGADSTALLSLLCRFGKQTGAPIFAAHVNHGIRGDEADRDEDFCRQTAYTLGVPLFVRRVSVPALAKEWGISAETAARLARYDFFDEIMRQESIPLLATAHNADDNLETMLFHMARGCGLTGLCGIPLTRGCAGGTVVRPLLSVTRKEILAYCAAEGLSYVTDSTNTHEEYARNRLRAHAVPALQSVHTAAVENAARLAEQLREDEWCLASMAELFLEGLREGDGVETEKLNGSPAAVVNRALIRLYRETAPADSSLTRVHLDALHTLSERNVPHSSLSLPGGVEAVIENDRLCFRKACPPPSEIISYSVPLREGVNRISQTNCEIVISSSQNTKNIYKNSILLSLDSDTIKGCLTATERRAGDRIVLRGQSRSVKKLLCEKKVPLSLRRRLPVLRDEQGIVAIPLLGVRDGSAIPHSGTNALFVCITWEEE